MVRVTALKLKVGAFRMVVPELLRSAFEVMRAGTVADGAALEIQAVPLIARCPRCVREIAVSDYVFFCPTCGSPLNEILSGKECDLVELVGDVEEGSAGQGVRS
jgi:hydrogenase nickel incorporation protein HypA/HybF